MPTDPDGSSATTIRAVLFDLDGTLYDRGAALRSFLVAQYSKRAHLLGGASRHRFIETFVARDANGSVRRDIVYPRLIADFGGDATSAPLFVADYVDGFGAYCRPPADLFPTLATLRAAGFRLGVITNGEIRIQEHTLTGLGLTEAFDTILISEGEGIRKPDAAIFLRALERLEVEPAAAVFVGDNPGADITGAKGAGLRAVWMANTVYPPPQDADATIHALGELPAIVAGW